MAYQTENTIDKREARVAAAMAFKEGDRVPIAPRIGSAYSQAAGITKYEAWNDYRLMKEGVENFLSRWESDLFWSPAAYPINVMEVLGTTAVRWPGVTCDLPRDSCFQIVDKCYMEQDEYDELIDDPSHFFMTKVFPRRHSKLSGLAKMSFEHFVEFDHYASLAQFSDPEVRESLLTLMAAGDQVNKWLEAQGMLQQTALEMQTPLGCVLGQNAPYDMLADNLRGYLELPMDLYEVPEKVEQALEVMTRLALKGVDAIHAAGMKYVFMPLHGGTDDIMSPENYEKFYLPSLRKVVEHELELGMTPYIFFEGKYDTRLEVIRDGLPKGILAMFEQVDIARARKVLDGHTCICGNLPGALLNYGKKEDVITETKKLIDDCAAGGGFIMDTSIVYETYNEENLDAWFETTMEYGKY